MPSNMDLGEAENFISRKNEYELDFWKKENERRKKYPGIYCGLRELLFREVYRVEPRCRGWQDTERMFRYGYSLDKYMANKQDYSLFNYTDNLASARCLMIIEIDYIAIVEKSSMRAVQVGEILYG